MKSAFLLAPAFAAFLLASSAYAQGGPAGQMNPARQPPSDMSAEPQPPSGTLRANNDRKFLQEAARGAAYELAIAKLAERKAARDDIKAYSKDVVQAHEKLNASLHELARKKHINVPSGMGAGHQRQFNRLESLNGKAFDQAYKEEITRINREDKMELRREANATQDQDIKNFVEQMQSVDAKHEEMAKRLQSKG